MWVVLLEDGIEFYKRKADNSPKGMVPLKGSSINSPCQDFGKRMVSTFLNNSDWQHICTPGDAEGAQGWCLQILYIYLVVTPSCLRRSQADLDLHSVWKVWLLSLLKSVEVIQTTSVGVGADLPYWAMNRLLYSSD